VDLHAQSLNVVGPVGPPSKIGQVELDLVPALFVIDDEWLDSHCVYATARTCNAFGDKVVVVVVTSSSLIGIVQMKGFTLVVVW
jgi:hypothetical protein